MTFYTRKEAAKILRVSVRTVDRALLRMGRSKGYMGKIRLSEDEIKRIAGVK